MTAVLANDRALGRIEDLLDEVSAKNHVRAVVYRAESKPGCRTIRRKTCDEISRESQALAPMLVMQDHLRILSGKEPMYLREALRRLGGRLLSITPNLRTTVGIDFAANALGSTQPSQADWIALSNNTVAVAAGDTAASLPWSTAQAADAAASGTTGEFTVLGVARKLATYAHSAGVTSYTMAATWTATGAVTALSKAGLFGGSTKNTAQSAAATNILFLENTFTSTTLANNDQLSLTWTVNI